jgi:hypothetical protein
VLSHYNVVTVNWSVVHRQAAHALDRTGDGCAAGAWRALRVWAGGRARQRRARAHTTRPRTLCG